MRTRRFPLTPALAVLGLSASLGLAETIEEVEKKLIEQIGKHKSLMIRSKSTTNMEMESYRMKQEADTLMEMTRKGDTWMSRVETKTTGTQKVGDEETKLDGASLMIFDGQFAYLYSEGMGQKTAMKTKPDPKDNQNPFDGKTTFAALRESFNLKLLPDETVEGKSAYAIECTPKNADLNPMGGKLVQYFAKDSGVVLKVVAYNKDGKPYLSSVSTEVKVDPSIPADRFVFKAPEGVTVQDLTQVPQEEEVEEEP